MKNKLITVLFPMITIFLLMLSSYSHAGTTENVSVDSSGNQANDGSYMPSINSDGRIVAFYSKSSNLVPNDTNGAHDIFIRDRATNTTKRVSVDSSGNQATDRSYDPSVSGNGRYVAFYSYDNSLVQSGTNRSSDVFVHDIQTGSTEIVSITVDGHYESYGQSYSASIDHDGRYVAFNSNVKYLVPEVTQQSPLHIYVRDMEENKTEIVSIDSNKIRGDAGSFYPVISGDGKHVAFLSHAANLVPNDTNGKWDFFVHDRVAEITKRVSVDSNGNEANDNGLFVEGRRPYLSISYDGRYIAFMSYATNLVPNDTNGNSDIFVHDTVTGNTERVSTDKDGNQAEGINWHPSISDDGRYVTFKSSANNLVSDNTLFADIFVKDRITGFIHIVSVDNDGNHANSGSLVASMSGDAQHIAFQSYATNLVPIDANGKIDIFVHTLGAGPCEDSDSDGVCNEDDICAGGDDNQDFDGDVIPDFCDVCPNDTENDADGDGVCGDIDVCTGGDDNQNADGDSLPDFCDVCPNDPENDAEDDGVCESDDNCPLIANADQFDTDQDGEGDACDADDDNDGVIDGDDNCQFDVNPDQADFDNDGAGDICDTDDDNDGIVDADDQCINTVAGETINETGCSIADLCACNNPWKNHGGYVKCVAHTSEDFVAAGLITDLEKDAIVSEAGGSNCGHKK